jgi:predicted XRE-type DNA-binding protein
VDEKMKATIETVHTGSGNVFADLGFEDAEERLMKAEFATRIAQLIERKSWS